MLFSQMKLIKTLLSKRANDNNLAKLMKIEVDGPALKSVNFQQILEILKGTNQLTIII